MDYKARFYDAALGMFTQPDSITPGGPQGLNRYSYAINNPLNYNDPTGHMASECGQDGEECGDYTDLDRAHDAYVAQRDEALRCQAGNTDYCSYAENHPVETVATTAAGLVGVAALPEVGIVAANAVTSAATTAWETTIYPGLVSIITNFATHNPDSSTVSIGSNDIYQSIGEIKGFTFFDLPEKIFGALDNLGVAQDVNSNFIANQIEQGKDFVVTSFSSVPGPGTQLEMDWIEASGIYSRITSAVVNAFTSWIYSQH